MPDARRLIIDLAIMFALAVVLALLGPFGMYQTPIVLRLIYWLAMAVSGYGLFMPAMVAARLAAGRLNLPEPAMWAAACALASLPMSAITWCANFIWAPPHWPTIDQAATNYANVVIVGGIACLVMWIIRNRRHGVAQRTEEVPYVDPGTLPQAPATPPQAADPFEQPPRLFERLPPHLRGDIVALEMEDHYVRAHTVPGSTLILLRMRDAVAELDGIDGAQVHRSWWVARAAVAGVARDGRNYRLKLVNGIEAPVARAMVATLDEQGWLSR